MTGQRARLTLESTGEPALDLILGGGLPNRTVLMIAGEPGSGKTVLTHQLLFAAARRGQKCLYFTTLAEPAIKIMRYMQMFDFFDQKLLDEKIIFCDLGSSLRVGADKALRHLEEQTVKHEPAYVVIDSFKVLTELLKGQPGGRSHIYDLAVLLSGWGATALLVGEYTRQDLRDFPEFGVADGIMYLQNERHDLTSVRQIEVLKLRGAAHRTGTHFFEINQAGVAFYPRVSSPDDVQDQLTTALSERVPFGVSGLDEVLGGGVPPGSATVIQGGTGTGKTLLALNFLAEGARRGERGVLFTLEETPSQVRAAAASVGLDLATYEKQGTIQIRYTSPVELSTDRFLYLAAQEMAQGAKRAVFDSLTTMSLGVASERRFKEMVYAITKHLRGSGVTSLMTTETVQLLGSAQISGDGISFIADNVIQLRYVELEGRLERALSVLKARGIKHGSHLQALDIDDHGLRVVPDRFSALRGVLTGLPMSEPRRHDPR
jgi:circadian clock protein KaiC